MIRPPQSPSLSHGEQPGHDVAPLALGAPSAGESFAAWWASLADRIAAHMATLDALGLTPVEAARLVGAFVRDADTLRNGAELLAAAFASRLRELGQ
jgi:hypothetical protein